MGKFKKSIVSFFTLKKDNQSQYKNILAKYNNKNNLLFIVQNEYNNQGFSLCTWELKNEKLQMNNIIHEEQNQEIIFLENIEQSNLICQLICAEIKCIKIYNIQENKNPVLRNRIHIKEEIQNIKTNEIFNLICVILKTGFIIIINTEGQIVSQIKENNINFKCLCCFQNYLFTGTSLGSLFVYNISTSKLLNQIQISEFQQFKLIHKNHIKQIKNLSKYTIFILFFLKQIK
ncbi:hypothetical protein IMG5_034570 [Ichthyophthirius multifiliis]|uniref:Uncharacterized protein n=1 Tax=Ichthyophthirius multifiliis TaxID=5932 RepID=G0QLP8_ICHMU|nr:hypothetical protein IMG5_034570 [Ichthyophthirius multifiliis]EGR33858.1 hypothetical protein IMG5_034570 [Ichthyophthirius multifiliis]|eukprot:XP_004039082.1 hypothetical protein IMG5_034570 [Ichthyophthirius multifiliis]